MKMKKNIFCIMFALLLCLSAVCSAFAEGDMPRLTDGAGLLSADERDELLGLLNEISERQKTDIVVVTTDTLDGKTPADYADAFYDHNGFGYGEEHDGVLLLVSMEDRDWYLSTCGFGITAITDDGLDYISGKFLPFMQDGDYGKAFLTYAKLCDEFISTAKEGNPYDGTHMPKEPFNVKFWLLAAVGVGIAVSLIVTGIMKSKLKSVSFQNSAASYVKANSLRITESRDMFLYHTVSRREKPKTSSGSGGSSTHTSSSGTTHGGGGGKF